MPIEVYQFTIRGISSLLMHSPKNMGQEQNGAGLKAKKYPPPEEEAEGCTYRNDAGNLYMPAIAARAALLGACMGRKIGKFSAGSQVAAGVFTVAPEIELQHPKTGKPITDFKIKSAPVVINKQRVVKHRPEIPEWQLTIPFEIDTDFVNKQQVAELLKIAGRTQGLGDWRPQKKGPHGRFELVS